jgi:polar amino acid transport system substrate-binding protein
MQRIPSKKTRVFLSCLCAVALTALPLGTLQAQPKQKQQPQPQPQAEQPLPPQAQPASGGVLDRARSSGKIVFGYRVDDAPMSYRDGTGQPAGFAVTICRKVALELQEQLNLPVLEVEWTPVSGATALQDIQQRKIDLLCSAEPVTLAKRAEVSFSAPIFLGGMAALVSRSAPAEFQHLLENKPPPYKPTWRGTVPPIMQHRTLSVVKGTAAVDWVPERLSSFKVTSKVSLEDSYAAAMTKVAKGESDALFGERSLLLAQAKQHPDNAKLKVLLRHFTYQPQALALPRNDDDFRLAVDEVLAEGMASPKFGEVYTSTFGEPDSDTIEFFRGTPR